MAFPFGLSIWPFLFFAVTPLLLQVTDVRDGAGELTDKDEVVAYLAGFGVRLVEVGWGVESRHTLTRNYEEIYLGPEDARTPRRFAAAQNVGIRNISDIAELLLSDETFGLFTRPRNFRWGKFVLFQIRSQQLLPDLSNCCM